MVIVVMVRFVVLPRNQQFIRFALRAFRYSPAACTNGPGSSFRLLFRVRIEKERSGVARPSASI
jgi:hypothetical protein